VVCLSGTTLSIYAIPRKEDFFLKRPVVLPTKKKAFNITCIFWLKYDPSYGFWNLFG
jgi:hypothetical protein